MIILINSRAIKAFAGMLLLTTGCSAIAFAIATGPKYDLWTEFGLIAVSLALYLITLRHGNNMVRTYAGPLASTSVNAVACAMMAAVMVIYGTGWIPLVAAAFYAYLGVKYYRLALRVVASRKQT